MTRQQARSVDDNRGTACENEKTLLRVRFNGHEMWIIDSGRKEIDKDGVHICQDTDKICQDKVQFSERVILK